MKNQCVFIVLFCTALASYATSDSRQNETGLPVITSYTPQTTGADPQTWAFLQDGHGVIYIGTAPGVLEYDGSSWRMIKTANKTFARSLAIDEDGRIYVGASADFGYLEPDAVGQLKYVSLLDYIPKENQVFSYVWTTIVTDKGIYFQTRERLFRFTPDRSSVDQKKGDGQSAPENWTVKIWKPIGRFNYAFWINGVYYVQQSGVGLMEMKNDSLHLLPGGSQFADERLQVMLPFQKDKNGKADVILVGTFNRGLFLYDGKSFQPFKTEADDFLFTNTVYDAVVLTDGTFCLATINGGAVIIDHNGRALQFLDQSTGLPGNSILATFVDRNGTLWLGPENGIVQIETPSPLSFYGPTSGLIGGVYDILRHNGILYVGTSNGVFFLDPATTTFKPVTGLGTGNLQSFSLLSYDQTLLVAVSTGLYRIEGNRALPIKQSVGLSFYPSILHRSLRDNKRLFVGLFDGLASFRLDKSETGQWISEGRIDGVHEYITNIIEIEPGVLWLGTSDRGLLRVTFSTTSLDTPQITRFGREHGLLTDGGVGVFAAEGQPIFVVPENVFRFNERAQKFEPDSMLSHIVSFGSSLPSNGVVEDSRGNIWINFGRETAVLKRGADGSFRTEKAQFQRFADLNSSDIYVENDGIVWIGSTEKLIRYNPLIEKDYEKDFPTLIRSVIAGGDSVIFGGLYPDGTSFTPELKFADNALRFEFAATTYDYPSGNKFQSIMEGFDHRWSPWTEENKRDYTNLPPGKYTFRVRGQNIYGHVGQEASYTFSILPPWYRTWAAYTLYGLMLIGLLFVADRVQRRRLTKKEREQSQLREAELRAEAAEATSKALQAENERKKNVELLSEIGKEITASLDFETIFYKLYQRVNSLADATIFAVGIFHPEKEQIEYKLAIEKGKRYAPYSRTTKNKDQFPVWCIENRKPVFINNVRKEYSKYIQHYSHLGRKLEDGSSAGEPVSMVYLPLVLQERVLGVISMQSFRENAYTPHHLNILQSLATYTTIALDNADAYRQLNSTLENLKATQEQLITQEKLASLGALTAGIAHEIKNPLNFVNNFADIIIELAEELRQDLEKHKDRLNADDLDNLFDILQHLGQNAKKISEHGKRADSIVRSMLQHSRGKSGERQDTDINAVLDEYINLAYHGMRAHDTSFNIAIEKEFDESIGLMKVVPQDISRVFLNIITNGFYEAHKKGIEAGDGFAAKLVVKSINQENHVEIRIRDNGNGIPEKVRDKLFEPFFTTKPTGKGTGLGLSLSYDIVVKEHGGDIRFETEEGEFTEFIIRLPR